MSETKKEKTFNQERMEFEESLDETDKHLFNLTFQAVQKSNNFQFKGVVPFLDKILENQVEMKKEIGDIKLVLKALVK